MAFRAVVLPLLPWPDVMDNRSDDERAPHSPLRLDEIENDRSRPAQRRALGHPTNIASRSSGLDCRRRAPARPGNATTRSRPEPLFRVGRLHVVLVDGNWFVSQ